MPGVMMLELVAKTSRRVTSGLGRRAIVLVKNLSTSEDAIDATINQLAVDLHHLNTDYAIVGGNALKAHGFKRFTSDVDVLLAKGGKEVFSQHLVGRGYSPRFEKAKSKFKNSLYNINIDLLESGEYPGDGKPKEIVFPHPKDHSFEVINSHGFRVKYLELSSIIELKLASYQSLPNDRERDKLDVIELVKSANLDEGFAVKLHPSIRGIYKECYQRAKKELDAEFMD